MTCQVPGRFEMLTVFIHRERVVGASVVIGFPSLFSGDTHSGFISSFRSPVFRRACMPPRAAWGVSLFGRGYLILTADEPDPSGVVHCSGDLGGRISGAEILLLPSSPSARLACSTARIAAYCA